MCYTVHVNNSMRPNACVNKCVYTKAYYVYNVNRVKVMSWTVHLSSMYHLCVPTLSVKDYANAILVIKRVANMKHTSMHLLCAYR